MTIVQKVTSLLKRETRLSLRELYEALPEHSHEAIRGNIYRYLRKCENPEFARVDTGVYAIIEIVKVKDNEDGTYGVNYAASFYNGEKEVHYYHKDFQTDDTSIAPGSYLSFEDLPNFETMENHYQSVVGIFENGDVRELLKRCKSNSFDLLVTDPPYRVISGGNGNKKAPKGMLSKNDGKIFAFNDIDFDEWLPDCFRVLKDGSHAYIFTNFLNLEALMKAVQEVGFQIHNLLVWEKNNANPNRWYMKNHEYVLLCRKGAAKPINNCGSKTVHLFKNLCGNKRHETEKPVDLLKFYIENSSNPGDWVLDPFAGSGSTAEAAITSGRKAVTFEIDPKYVGIIHERMLGAIG